MASATRSALDKMSFKRRERRLSKDADPHALSEEPGAPTNSGGEILLMAGEVGDPHHRELLASKSAISDIRIVGAYSCHGMNKARPKANQDCGCIAHPLGSDEAAVLLAVYDGHGSEGTAVSAHILKTMHVQVVGALSAPTVDPAAALTTAFNAVQADVVKLSKQPFPKAVDANESGACSLVAYLRERTLWVANAGDCVAVLARAAPPGQAGGSSGDGAAGITEMAARMADVSLKREAAAAAPPQFSALKLSTEHKPNLPSEKKR